MIAFRYVTVLLSACAAFPACSSTVGDSAAPRHDASEDQPTMPSGSTSPVVPAQAEQPDGGTDSTPDDHIADACAKAAPPGRGLVEVVYAGGGAAGSAAAVRSVGVACGTLYLGSDRGTGARPWETGTVRKCAVSSCAATTTTLPTWDLHFATSFVPDGDGLLAFGQRQPFYLGAERVPAADTPGDVVSISGLGAAKNLGPILDVAAAPGASFGHMIRRGSATVIDRRGYHNHGDYRGVVVIRDIGGTAIATEVAVGSEVGGYSAVATPTRVFAIGHGMASGALLVDVASATSVSFYSGTFQYGFAHGERIGGVGITSPFGAGEKSQVLCEADGSCMTPTVIANNALPDRGYLGVFGDDLVWHEPSSARPNVATLKSCSLASWGTAACTPTTLADGVPVPESDAASDGVSIFFVAQGDVIRVGL